MQINTLKRQHKNKGDRLVGRGGKHAKTSGRGGKGQTARAGNKRRPELRDIIKKLPKHRGYQFKSFQVKPVGFSLDKITSVYPKGGAVNPTTLLELRAIKKKKGWLPEVKILAGKGDFNLKIQVSKCLVSDSAKEQIMKAGGEITPLKDKTEAKVKNKVKAEIKVEKKAKKSK
jgi:large subunit ribosomal protein L15